MAAEKSSRPAPLHAQYDANRNTGRIVTAAGTVAASPSLDRADMNVIVISSVIKDRAVINHDRRNAPSPTCKSVPNRVPRNVRSHARKSDRSSSVQHPLPNVLSHWRR